jgi:hypothetical protein
MKKWLHKGPIVKIFMCTQLIIFFPYSNALGAEGWQSGRFRIIPKLSLLAGYSDNVYLIEDGEVDDIYTVILPEISFDLAVAPKNYLSLKYEGFFIDFDEVDNFDNAHHLGELSWHSETAKGTTFSAGTSIDDNSIQPYSAADTAKEYKAYRAFVDLLLMAGSMTEIGAGYERLSRRFDEDRFKFDDYDRNRYDISLLYKKSEKFPLLLEYRFVQQDNNDPIRDISTDYDTHTIFVGSRWRPDSKLSGALRVGYINSNFDSNAIEDFNGIAADIDITYRISEITQFRLLVERDVRPTTRTSRDTGNYYVLSGAEIVLTHHKWKRIITELSYIYSHRDYENGVIGIDRIDRYHDAGILLRYLLNDSISFSLAYHYRNNDSDLRSVEYTENVAELGILFEI